MCEAVRLPSQQLGRGVKRKRAGNSENQNKEKEPKKIVQNGLYVAEICTSTRHLLCKQRLHLYVWFFDRENAIQGAAINFVQDLPRFLVLLLIMQRMQYEQWGLNRVFEPEPGFSGTVIVEDTQINLQLDVGSDERKTRFGIRGRTTTVFPVKSKALSDQQRDRHLLNRSVELVAKLYWPEETRQSEPVTLKKVYDIAQTDPDVQGHVPEMVWFRKFEETSTSKIKVALGLKDAEQAEQGSRVLYIIVFRKLIPITTLSGKEFLAAWWQIVKCHRALWKKGVFHRDVSLSNLMGYYCSDGRFMGVLNDYDLSSFKRDGPSGLERTGTIPFMAINLLMSAAITGNIEHIYAHDAESFIWVLTWVCLLYENGKLIKDRPLEEWQKMDAVRCRKEKNDFISVGLHTMRPTKSHEESWDLVNDCFLGIYMLYPPTGYRRPEDEAAFESLLNGPMLKHEGRLAAM